MKTMTIRLGDTEYDRLKALASAEDRTMADVLREAIHDYIQREASHAEFRASLERAMQENAQMIAQLADC